MVGVCSHLPQSSSKLYGKMTLLLFVLFCACSRAERLNALDKDLSFFVGNNSKGLVTIVCEDRPSCQAVSGAFMRDSLLPTRCITLDQQEFGIKDDFTVYIGATPKLNELLMLITGERVQSSLLFFPEDLQDQDWNAVRQNLSTLKRNSHFYLATGTSVPLSWYRVITLNHQADVVINELHFLTHSYIVKEDYDLQGVSISSTSDTWPPFITFYNCSDGLKGCTESHGLLHDVSISIEQMFNFTLDSKQGQEGWGVLPITGPFNLSGTWGGVKGDVLHGVDQMSLSPWAHLSQRVDLLDHVPLVLSSRSILLLVPQRPKVDFTLFLRPFTAEAWELIIAVSVVIILLVAVPQLFYPDYDSTNVKKVASTTAWSFFVLINAFYGGALTMFFTTEEKIPFQGIRDVLRSSDWQLLAMDGRENNSTILLTSLQLHLLQEWRRYTTSTWLREIRTTRSGGPKSKPTRRSSKSVTPSMA